jgi:hypothetical protein
MALIPTYDPKSFASVDLRKYHIRDIKDVIKFHEFVSSRMEECSYVLKKFNTQMATFKAVTKQLQKKQEVQQMAYGNPNFKAEEKPQSNAPEIQTVDRSVEKQHEELLNDIRQAQADENLAEQIESDEPLEAILGKYKLVYGKRGPMYYRENEEGKIKLVKKSDVPEDIKQQLLNTIGKDA